MRYRGISINKSVIIFIIISISTVLYLDYISLHNSRNKSLKDFVLDKSEARYLIMRIFYEATGYRIKYILFEPLNGDYKAILQEKEEQAEELIQKGFITILECLNPTINSNVYFYIPKELEATIYSQTISYKKFNLSIDNYAFPYVPGNLYFIENVFVLYKRHFSSKFLPFHEFKTLLHTRLTEHVYNYYADESINAKIARYETIFSVIMLFSIGGFLGIYFYDLTRNQILVNKIHKILRILFILLALLIFITLKVYNYKFRINCSQEAWDQYGMSKAKELFYLKTGKKIRCYSYTNKEPFLKSDIKDNQKEVVIKNFRIAKDEIRVITYYNLKEKKDYLTTAIVTYLMQTSGYMSEVLSPFITLEIIHILSFIGYFDDHNLKSVKTERKFFISKDSKKYSIIEMNLFKEIINEIYRNKQKEHHNYLSKIILLRSFFSLFCFILLADVIISVLFYYFYIRPKHQAEEFKKKSKEEQRFYWEKNIEARKKKQCLEKYLQDTLNEQERAQKKEKKDKEWEKKLEDRKKASELKQAERAKEEEEERIREEERKKLDAEAHAKNIQERKEKLISVALELGFENDELIRNISEGIEISELDLYSGEQYFYAIKEAREEKASANNVIPDLMEQAENLFDNLPPAEQQSFLKKMNQYRIAFQKGDNPRKVKKNLEWIIKKMSELQ